MAYDSERGRTVVLLPGTGATWEWDGTSWSQEAVAPLPAGFGILAYDSGRGRTVLLGFNGSGFGTWELPAFAAPVANPGPNRTVNVGTLVDLDGSGSGADDLLTVTTYAWARAGGTGPAIALSATNVTTPAFTPVVAGTYAFSLTVTDSHGITATVTAPVIISANGIPTVSAGPDHSIHTSVSVSLTAVASDVDGDSLSYSWSRTGGNGPSVSLSGATSPSASFTAFVTGTFTFAVTVSDGRGGFATAPVTITLVNAPPTVSAGPNITAFASTAVVLNATASDPDGDPISYSWQRVGNPVPGVALYQANTASANFSPTVAGTYDFQVTASDGLGGTAQSTVRVTVLADTNPPDDHPNNFDGVTANDNIPTAGTAVAAKIDYPRDIDFFQFDALAGQTYEIALVSGAGLTGTTMSVSVFDPLRRLVARATSNTGLAAIPQFRPQNTASYFLEVATIASTATGSYQVSVRGSGTVTVPLPPPLSVTFSRLGNSLDATIRTSGTTVPLSALTVLLEYDSRHLAPILVQSGPAASAFNPATQQFTPPFLSVGFTSKEIGYLPVPSGILALVSFAVAEDSDPLDTDLAVTRALATFPAGFGDALRPTADPGRAPFVVGTHALGKGKAALYPDPLAPASDNLRPFVRLDARASLDSNPNPQILNYHWTQVSGPPVVLSAPSSPVATFVPVGGPGSYVFQLAVDNAVLQSPPRQVVISIDQVGSIPVAAPRVRSAASGQSAGPLDPPLVVPRGTQLVLDAGNSTHPVAALRQGLRFAWTQLTGLASLPLTPAATIPIATGALLGNYRVQLSVTDTQGRTSTPETVAFVVAPATQPPVTLSLFSAASGLSVTGSDSTENDPAPPAPLRVPVNGTVTLTARATAPSVAAGQTTLLFRWKQLSGPVDASRQQDGRTTPNMLSSLSFTAAVPGLRRYLCEVREQDLGGNPTGQAASRVIAVAVDSVVFVVPTARAAIGASGSPLAQPSIAGSAATTLPTGTAIALDARGCKSAAGLALAYHWVQIDGPPVVLSNPFAPVTTFAPPSLGDATARAYTFQLFVDDGNLSSENVAAQLAVVPLVNGTLTLARGLNLVGLRFNPSTPGHAYTAGDLLRDSGATWVAVPDISSGRTRFHVFTAATDPTVPAVQGSAGYLVFEPSYRAVALQGLGWPTASATLNLATGLNTLSYPFGSPPGEAASTLATRTGSPIVSRLGAPDSTGRRHFQPYLSNLSADYRLSPGEGYLISVPSARTVTLPAGQ